jgi:putative NADPH-quinone reductase
MAQCAIDVLQRKGHDVAIEDLYASKFSPSLTESERQSYYTARFDAAGTQEQCERLMAAEAMVLVFPTWWFSFPGMLKGWFDRVWAPGVAYDHASDLGPIKPRLHNLKKTLAITSLGSPWWVDRFVLRQPVKRVLKTALLGTCAPQSRFKMLSLYQAEKLKSHTVQQFRSRVERALATWS